MKRRDFLARAVKVGGATVTAAIVLPVAVTIFAPLSVSRPRGTWAKVGPIREFAPGRVTLATIEVPRDDWAQALRKRGVFVWRPSEEEVVVFSRSCTDLGCPVTWDPGNGWYYCPCHGGIFDREGRPRKGPPKHPLHRYRHRIKEDALEIDLDSVPPSA